MIYISQQTQILDGKAIQVLSLSSGTRIIQHQVAQKEDELFVDFLNRTNQEILKLSEEIKSKDFPMIKANL